MINFDEDTGESTQEHKPCWPQIPDHSYRTPIDGASGSGKTNALLNFINHQPDIDENLLHAKDPYESKYQYFQSKYQCFIKKREVMRLT